MSPTENPGNVDKTFANLPMTFVFLAFQFPLLRRHSLEPPEA